MKSNLDGLYKMDGELETNGSWCWIKENVGFKIKRFGGSNKTMIAKIKAEKEKPYAAMIRKKQMSQEKLDEIYLDIFVTCCFVDWKGIELDGKSEPFNKEKCFEFLKGLPDLQDELMAFALDAQNYNTEYREELGNF